MTLGLTTSVALLGLTGNIVEVEVDIADGIPMYSLLGLPDAALTESRDRVRAAISNCGEVWPNRKVTVSMSPAWLPKSGSSFDLAIALAILVAQQGAPQEPLEKTLILGELALDGKIRPVRGVLPSLIAAFQSGITRAIVPAANKSEAALMEQMEILTFETLSELLIWLRTGVKSDVVSLPLDIDEENNYLDFADVAGQSRARFAAEVAASGGHHLLLIGPPGAGKTMIASRIPTILPRLSVEQALEVTAVHSISGGLGSRSPMSRIAPIVSPHHSASRVAIVGGGSHVIKPGACSLAHHGVLFIDEAPECAVGVLDSLRQPLESSTITIARSVGNITFPAQFLLVLAANPCPCGKFSGRGRNCTCSSLQVRRYLGKLSGPLMDRIDMRVQVEPVGRTEMAETTLGETSEAIRARVIAARDAASERFKNDSWKLNSQIPSRELRTIYKPEKKAMNFLHDELDRERITARGLHKVIRLGWTLADLAGRTVPHLEDVERAYMLREGSDI
ncbi:COG0606 Predicted ATPase with chaperone activity [Candidatus Nanopelagicaceae bacterium]